MGKTIPPTAAGIKNLTKTMRRLVRRFPKAQPFEPERIPTFYSGAKRLAYQTELNKYHAGVRLCRHHAKCKCFVKWEKTHFKPSKVNPDPRMIQFRDRYFGLHYACYVKAAEYALKNFKFSGRGMPHGQVWTKGMTLKQRGELIQAKMQRFASPRAVSLDGSRHDKHYRKHFLEIEHIAYRHIFGDDRKLEWMLKQQYNNVVYSHSGLKMRHDKRISGEFSTSLGNGLGCVNMIITAARTVGLAKFDVIDDGDDVVLFYEAQDHGLTLLLPGVYSTYGYKLEVVDEADCLEGIEFCSHRPIRMPEGSYTMCRDPSKVIGTMLVGTKYLNDPRQRAALINTIGICNTYMFRGLPILQAYSHALIRIADTDKQVDWRELDQFRYKLGREMNTARPTVQPPDPIADVTRVSFFKAFGIGVMQQRRIESFLKSWTFTVHAQDLSLDPFDVPHWSWVTPRIHFTELNEYFVTPS